MLPRQLITVRGMQVPSDSVDDSADWRTWHEGAAMGNGRAEGTGQFWVWSLPMFARVGAGWSSATWALAVSCRAAHFASACPLQMHPQETILCGQGCQRTYHREHHRMGQQGQNRAAAGGLRPQDPEDSTANVVFKAKMRVCVLMDSNSVVINVWRSITAAGRGSP